MKKYLILLLFTGKLLYAYSGEIPSEIEFGGMQLQFTEEVRRLLKADVDMINRSAKAFQTKVDRANLYFPIIERIFKEEGLPDDFKFLSLQESSLVSDAVSSSNAVGYWQFKKEAATEVGLRVDDVADERMNIAASSRGAAKYIKKNNLLLNNWIYSLLAYNLGPGGVRPKVEEKYRGANKMEIDGNMHWYVIRFLAHKLAYQDAVGKDFNPPLMLMVYNDCKGKSLNEIANETEIFKENIDMYNKWLRVEKVPADKTYFVIIPVTLAERERILAKSNIKIQDNEETKTKKNYSETKVKFERKEKKKNDFDYSSNPNDVPLFTSVNGIKAIKAKAGDNPARLASAAGISVDAFLRNNDLKSFDQVKAGECYYLQLKKNKALVFFHTVQPGETLWDISQKYGIRIEAIRKKNRLGKKENPQKGMVLWLREVRPKTIPVEIMKIPDAKEIKKETVEIPLPAKDTLTKKENTIAKTSDVANTEGNFHIVKPGETLYAISKMYSVSIDSLKIWNQLWTSDLKQDQKLLVKKEQAKDSFIFHIVEPGETFYKISRKYGVSVQEIQQWNNKADLNLSTGEKLLIKSRQ